jgi:hypothetical protein
MKRGRVMNTYTVITGDIINSRQHNLSSKQLQEKIGSLKYPDLMVTPFKALKGDEIQGVIRGFLPVPQILRRLRYCIYPYKVRLGIGVGKIEQGLDRGNSWEMNGPAFYRAREALNQLKDNNLNYNVTKINSGNQKLDLALNTILLLIDTLQSSWTDSQWEAVYYYEKLGTYKKAAEKLNIAFQNVEKRCNAANWRQIDLAERNIKKFIELQGDGFYE